MKQSASHYREHTVVLEIICVFHTLVLLQGLILHMRKHQSLSATNHSDKPWLRETVTLYNKVYIISSKLL